MHYQILLKSLFYNYNDYLMNIEIIQSSLINNAIIKNNAIKLCTGLLAEHLVLKH